MSDRDTERQITLLNMSVPLSVMRFVLVYRGELPASQKRGKPDAIKKIREQLHPQLEKLWQVSPALIALQSTARIADPNRAGSGRVKISGVAPGHAQKIPNYPLEDWEIDLSAPIKVQGKQYRPLVRSSLNTSCKLNIQFLRADDQGSLRNGAGDLDNRIKTLFDALEMPAEDSLPGQLSNDECTYCLCENDKLITDFDISSDRLLLPDTASQKEVHLIIEVIIGVTHVGLWNLPLVSNAS